MPTEYAVEIGCSLFDAIWDKMWSLGNYRIKGVYEEGDQKFAIMQDRDNLKLFRLDFQYDEQNGFVPANEVVEVTETFNAAATQYSEEDILAYEAKRAEPAAEPVTENSLAEPQPSEPEAEPTEDPVTENALQEGEPAPAEDPIPAPTYSLDDVVEYQELLNKYSALETEHQAMQEELTTLREFKLAADRKEKQAMIDKFYMLSDENKQDVIEFLFCGKPLFYVAVGVVGVHSVRKIVEEPLFTRHDRVIENVKISLLASPAIFPLIGGFRYRSYNLS